MPLVPSRHDDQYEAERLPKAANGAGSLHWCITITVAVVC